MSGQGVDVREPNSWSPGLCTTRIASTPLSAEWFLIPGHYVIETVCTQGWAWGCGYKVVRLGHYALETLAAFQHPVGLISLLTQAGLALALPHPDSMALYRGRVLLSPGRKLPLACSTSLPCPSLLSCPGLPRSPQSPL